MAAYSASTAKHIAALTASQVDSITLSRTSVTRPGRALSYDGFRISSRGTAEIFAVYGAGTVPAAIGTPTVNGDNTLLVPGNSTVVVEFPATSITVKVVSGGTPGCSVEAVNL